MFKQSPSRNHRSKGIKIRHVLQFCLLLAACFWLIYQVKHSHVKSKEFDENDAKISFKMQNGKEVLKFGRKDIHPRVGETNIKNEKRDDEEVEEETGGEEGNKHDEDEEETGGEEENKHEEEEQEEDSNSDEREDEGRGDGDDEIDEQDQDKSDVEVDHGEDFVDEEKEGEEVDEKESEETDAEDKESDIENGSSSDHYTDGGGRNSHGAREEHYKADDASSAVTHNIQVISVETDKLSLGNSNKTPVNTIEQGNEANKMREIDVGQDTAGLKVGDGEKTENKTVLDATVNKGNGEKTENETLLDATVSEGNGLGTVYLKSKNSSPVDLNSIRTTESRHQPEESNNSTKVILETHGLSLQQRTVNTSNSTPAQLITLANTTSGEGSYLQSIPLEKSNDPNLALDNNHSSLNSSLFANGENAGTILGASLTPSNGSNSVLLETIDATQYEKLDTRGGMDRTNESSKIEHEEEVQHDPNTSDTSIPLEEREDNGDLDAMRKTRTDGNNSENVTAE